MGVLDKAKAVYGSDGLDGDRDSYVCLACEETFDVQYHSCPSCGSYDVRRRKWVE